MEVLALALIANGLRQPRRHNIRGGLPRGKDLRNLIIRSLSVPPQRHCAVGVRLLLGCRAIRTGLNRLEHIAAVRLFRLIELHMQHIPQIVLAGNLRLVLIHGYAARTIVHKVRDRIPIWEVGVIPLFLLPDSQGHPHGQRTLIFHIHLEKIQRYAVKAILILICNYAIFIHLELVAKLCNGQWAKVGKIQRDGPFRVFRRQTHVQHAGLKIRTDPFGIHIPSKGGPSQQRQHKQKRDNR